MWCAERCNRGYVFFPIAINALNQEAKSAGRNEWRAKASSDSHYSPGQWQWFKSPDVWKNARRGRSGCRVVGDGHSL